MNRMRSLCKYGGDIFHWEDMADDFCGSVFPSRRSVSGAVFLTTRRTLGSSHQVQPGAPPSLLASLPPLDVSVLLEATGGREGRRRHATWPGSTSRCAASTCRRPGPA
ncbi:hypothetical protein E2C01_101189 [Portunus trituberculatus]|uniref:Uncharacterized protein n=1 Tax=Portunus trituberculatus TaxID=210409 RepID=A0A5B7KA03_PORTR|nr:hypothetical protein [Portunus trituberculatus]